MDNQCMGSCPAQRSRVLGRSTYKVELFFPGFLEYRQKGVRLDIALTWSNAVTFFGTSLI